MANPNNQTFSLKAADGHLMALWLPAVDATVHVVVSQGINYGVQLGACIVMLLAMLTMTARTCFARTWTLLNLAGLAVCILRCSLLLSYYISNYTRLYSLFSGDLSFVPHRDAVNSAVATFFALPQLVLIEAVLGMQALAMLKLWSRSVWRVVAAILSVLVVLPAMGFKCAAVVLQMRATLQSYIPYSYVWVHQCDLIFSTITIIWFCFLFIVRLILHMWEYRSILPPVSGLSPMEVLAIANGLLMTVPVIFAALEFFRLSSNFEPASLATTTVVVILPLGTLIAQKLSRPNAHSSQNRSDRGNGRGSDSIIKRRLFQPRSHHSSDVTATAIYTTTTVAGNLSTRVTVQSGRKGSAASNVADALDREPQIIDDTCQGDGRNNKGGAVWIGHEVEVKQNMV